MRYWYQIERLERNGWDFDYTPVSKPSKVYDSVDDCRKAARARLIRDKVTAQSGHDGNYAMIYRGKSQFYESLHLASPGKVLSDKFVEILPDGRKEVIYSGHGHYRGY